MPTPRIASLARIAKLYYAVEQVRSASLQQANVALQEAEAALSTERSCATLAHGNARHALDTGDRAEWVSAAALGDVAGIRAERVEGVRVTRAATQDTALQQFLESRIQTEQMNLVVRKMAHQAATEEMRRAQLVTDDRHLARLRWLEARRRNKEDRVLGEGLLTKRLV